MSCPTKKFTTARSTPGPPPQRDERVTTLVAPEGVPPPCPLVPGDPFLGNHVDPRPDAIELKEVGDVVRAQWRAEVTDVDGVGCSEDLGARLPVYPDGAVERPPDVQPLLERHHRVLVYEG